VHHCDFFENHDLVGIKNYIHARTFISNYKHLFAVVKSFEDQTWLSNRFSQSIHPFSEENVAVWRAFVDSLINTFARAVHLVHDKERAIIF